MDVFKEYDHIFLTTVLLISSVSTFAVAVCTLPTELHNSVWNYQYTDLSNNAQTTTLTFGRTTLTGPSNIRLNALGTILNAWTCISNLTLSSAASVAVFKSDRSYSDFNGNTKWVYLCMKLNKVADDLFYFYLLSDADSSVYPEERVYQSGSIPDNTVNVCSTFCQYTTQPKIRTLTKSGSSATLPGDVSLCEPCDSACDEEIDITTNLTETTEKTTIQLHSTEILTTTEMTLLETTEQSTSTEKVTTTEMSELDTTQKTTEQFTSAEVTTITEISTKETAQNITLPASSTNLVTATQKTTMHVMVDFTETNSDINVVNTDAEDITTMATYYNVYTENLKTFSGLITVTIIGCVIITFVYTKGHSRVKTKDRRPEKEDDITLKICYTIYKGKAFGFQRIAIPHWDYYSDNS